jgi:hypothetical protein
LEESTLLKCPSHHRNLQFQCNPHQNKNEILHRTRTKHFYSKSLHETPPKEKNPNSQSNLEQKEQDTTYYKAIVVKTVLYWHKKESHRPRNTMESLKVNPHTYSQLIFSKGSTNTLWKKDGLFNKGSWESWISTYKKRKKERN